SRIGAKKKVPTCSQTGRLDITSRVHDPPKESEILQLFKQSSACLRRFVDQHCPRGDQHGAIGTRCVPGGHRQLARNRSETTLFGKKIVRDRDDGCGGQEEDGGSGKDRSSSPESALPLSGSHEKRSNVR